MSQKKDEPTGAEPAGTDESHAAPADIREQMRLALERKQGRQGESHATAAGNKASTATSNAKVQREFRRKSGG